MKESAELFRDLNLSDVQKRERESAGKKRDEKIAPRAAEIDRECRDPREK